MSEIQESSIQDFSEWILKIGNGDLGEGDGDNNITIPHDLIIQPTQNPLEDIINNTYPDLNAQYMVASYIQERAILGPTHEVVEDLNDYIISSINGVEHEYLSSDSISTCMFVPRITLSPSDSKWPFVLKRRQFPSLCVLQ